MKKIVGIIAAVAMAASVFAMDISGGLKVSGNLFDLSFADDSKPTILDVGLDSGGYYWGSRLQAGFSGEKAGGQFALSYHGWEDADKLNFKIDDNKKIESWHPTFMLHDQQVWVQPIDMLKITMLNTGDNLGNDPFFDGNARTISAGGAWQIGLTPIDGLSINVTLASPWIQNEAIGETALGVKYGADFGKISFLFVARQGAKDKNFKKLDIGAGYSNTFGDIAMFANVVLNLNTDDARGKLEAETLMGTVKIDKDQPSLQKVIVDGQATYTKDAITLQGYARYDLNNVFRALWGEFDSDLKKEIKEHTDYRGWKDINDLMIAAKVSYAMDACTPYLFVKTSDILVQKMDEDYLGTLDLQIKPGVTFNIGAASCEVAAQFDLKMGYDLDEKTGTTSARKGNLSVPFNVAVSW